MYAPVHAGTLYALGQDAQLMSVDPQSFKTTNIGKPVESISFGVNLASMDTKNSIYYYVGYQWAKQQVLLVGVSLKDGSVVGTLPLPFAYSNNTQSRTQLHVQFVDVDPNSDGVYVTGQLDASPTTTTVVVRASIRTNTYVQVADIKRPFVDIADYSVLDYGKNILYVEIADHNEGAYYLTGVDVKNGTLTKSLENDYELEAAVYDPVSGLVYGFAYNDTYDVQNRRVFASLDMQAGDYREIAPLDGYDYVYAYALSAFDVKGRKISVLLRPYAPVFYNDLLTIDVDSGKVTSRKVNACYDSTCPWSLQYSIA